VPEKIELNANHKENMPKAKKSIINPYYESTFKSKNWQTEKSFISLLDKQNSIDWWFKNGEGYGTYFAVPYIDEIKEDQTFYVDFIIKLKDGRIGLFDTKAGWTASSAGTRSDGLQRYIKKQNEKGKNLFGGIVIPKANSFYTYKKVPYRYDKQLTGWEIVEI
jgi:type III restriction enzyme